MDYSRKKTQREWGIGYFSYFWWVLLVNMFVWTGNVEVRGHILWRVYKLQPQMWTGSFEILAKRLSTVELDNVYAVIEIFRQ